MSERGRRPELARLEDELHALGPVVVAFSGGADSAFLAWVATSTLGVDRAHCVTAVSSSLASSERADCAALAREWGLRWTEVETDELSHDEYVAKGRVEAIRLAGLVFDALGATSRTHVDDFFGAGHIMGTYCMGTNPRSSVVDPLGRTHDHRNLFLLGSGLFPTGATANPTLTLAALALRSATEIGRAFAANELP